MKIKAAVLALLLVPSLTFASTFSCVVNDRLNGGNSIATVKEYDSGYKMKIFGSGVEFETLTYMKTRTTPTGVVINQSFPAMVKATDGSDFMVTMQRAYVINNEREPVFTVFANEKQWLYTTNCTKMEDI